MDQSKREKPLLQRLMRLAIGAMVLFCRPTSALAIESLGAHTERPAGAANLNEGPFVTAVRKVRAECEQLELWTLRSDLVPKENRLNLARCLDHADNLHRWLDDAPPPAISDKENAIHEMGIFLTFIRSRNEAARKSALDGPPANDGSRLVEGVALEHTARRALSRLKSYETWEGIVSIGGGVLQRAHLLQPLVGMRAGLSIDLGQNIDGLAEIATGSPRNEGTGYVTLPPVSSELLYMSQLWVRSRQFKRLQLWFGVRPDEADPVAPERWPFVGLGGRIAMVPSGGKWDLDLAVRHDVFGIWDASTDLYSSTRVERNLTFLTFNFLPVLTSDAALQFSLRSAFHWYSDPNGTLRRLSLGRHSEVVPDFDRQAPFRIIKLDAFARFRAGSGLMVEPFVSSFWNVEARSDRIGTLAKLALQVRRGDWLLSGEGRRSQVGCDAAPPVALAQHLFPGQRTNGIAASALWSINTLTAIDFNIMTQKPTVMGAADNCPWKSKESQRPHTTNYTAQLALIVTFSPGNR